MENETMLSDKKYLSRGELIEQLGYSIEEAIELGIAETEDRMFFDKNIERRTAVRIIHEYMKRCLNLPDLDDISKAEKLKDLYDCHICVNHIAQVFCRGIMSEYKLGEFGLKCYISKEEAEDIAKRINDIRGLTC